MREYQEHIPELSRYKLPSRRPADEVYLLKTMCDSLRKESRLGLSYLTEAQRMMFDQTPPSYHPVWFKNGCPRLDDVLEAIDSQNRVKHPGFPSCLLGATKGVVIDRYTPDLVEAIYARIIMLKFVAPRCKTPSDFYRTFCGDPSSFSIKLEAVKLDKLGRGLAGQNLVGSCIEKLLYLYHAEAFKDGRFESYSAIGIGFTRKDSVLLHMCTPQPAAQSDVPSFDWTVTEDESLLNVDVAFHAMGASDLVIPKTIAVQHERSMARSFFVTSDGRFWQAPLGGQRTGRDMTSLWNTKTRARRSFAVDLRLIFKGADIVSEPICAGDDCSETPHPDKEKTYNELGFPLRDYHEAVEIEFCSHDWPPYEAPIGKRIYKSTFNLLLEDMPQQEQFEAFCREYSRHEDFPAIIPNIFVARPEMKLLADKMISNMILRDNGSPSYDSYSKKGKGQKGPKPKGKGKGGQRRVAGFAQRSVVPTAKRVSSVPRGKVSRMPVHKAICSVTDPFCVHARGAQRPDGGPPSIPFQMRAVTTLVAVSTTGGCRYTFVPSPLFHYAYSTFTSPNWVTAASWSNATGTGYLNTYAKEIRIVSFGIVIRSSMTATTAKGLVICSTEQAPGLNGVFTPGSMSATESVVTTMAAGMELAWVSKPIGHQAHEFKPITNYTNTQTDFDWTSLIVEVSASDTTASIPYLTAEIVMNVEFTARAGEDGASAAIAQLTKTPPPPNNAAIAASAHSIATRPSFIEGGIAKAGALIEKQAKSSLDSIMADGMSLLFGML